MVKTDINVNKTICCRIFSPPFIFDPPPGDYENVILSEVKQINVNVVQGAL